MADATLNGHTIAVRVPVPPHAGEIAARGRPLGARRGAGRLWLGHTAAASPTAGAAAGIGARGTLSRWGYQSGRHGQLRIDEFHRGRAPRRAGRRPR